MTTTADEMIVARSWMGGVESEDTFNERFDRQITLLSSGALVGDALRAAALSAAIEESLRAQLTAMTLESPSSASAEGMSYSNTQNMISLQKQLDRFSSQQGSRHAQIIQRVRADRSR